MVIVQQAKILIDGVFFEKIHSGPRNSEKGGLENCPPVCTNMYKTCVKLLNKFHYKVFQLQNSLLIKAPFKICFICHSAVLFSWWIDVS